MSSQICHHRGWVLQLGCGIQRFDLLLLTANTHCDLIVDQDTDHGSSLRVESEAEGVETWCVHDNHGSILLPEEVVRAGVDRLHLPRHHIQVLKISRLPDPASHAVFCAKSLIDQGLVVECISKLLLLDA